MTIDFDKLKIEECIEYSLKRDHTSPEWGLFLQIADRVARDLQAANAAVKSLRKTLNHAKFSSSAPHPPQTPYYGLCLIGVLMRNAWLFLLPLHQSDIPHKLFPRKIAKPSTHPALRAKMIALMHTWSLFYRDSLHYPKFFVSFQALLPSLPDAASLPSEPYSEPFAPIHSAPHADAAEVVVVYSLPSAALLPPLPHEHLLDDPEIVATRTHRISHLLDLRCAKFRLLEELLLLLDPPDIDTNETVLETYPLCKQYHGDVLRWIDEGQVSEACTVRLLGINDQMLRILALYDNLRQGFINDPGHPAELSPDLSPDSIPYTQDELDFDEDDESRSGVPLLGRQQNRRPEFVHPTPIPSSSSSSPAPRQNPIVSPREIIVLDPSESLDHDYEDQSSSTKPLIR